MLEHQNTGLKQALLHEKKKRQRGKTLHLYRDGETEGQGRFFSPERVKEARASIRVAEDAKTQEQLDKLAKKRELAVTRADKVTKKEEDKQRREIARQAARDLVAAEKAEKRALQQ